MTKQERLEDIKKKYSFYSDVIGQDTPLFSDVDWLIARVEKLEAALKEIVTMVDDQANDEGLWCPTYMIGEAMVQHGLRKLHALIEDRFEALNKPTKDEA